MKGYIHYTWILLLWSSLKKCIASIKAVIVLPLFYVDAMMLQIWKQQDLSSGTWSYSSYIYCVTFLQMTDLASRDE